MYQSYPCDYSLPAEWSPQSGIMLTWPHGGTDWKPYLRQITDTYLELSEIITRYEQLLIATPIVESTRRMLASRLSKEQMDRVHLYDIDSNDTWARDHGGVNGGDSRGRGGSRVLDAVRRKKCPCNLYNNVKRQLFVH